MNIQQSITLERLPNVLYHGTNLKYYNQQLYHGTNLKYYNQQLEKHSKYEMETHEVHLAENPIDSLFCAVRKGKYYNSIPLVLIIDPSKLSCDLLPHKQGHTSFFICEYLNKESYVAIPLKMKKEQTSLEDKPTEIEFEVSKWLAKMGKDFIAVGT